MPSNKTRIIETNVVADKKAEHIDFDLLKSKLDVDEIIDKTYDKKSTLKSFVINSKNTVDDNKPAPRVETITSIEAFKALETQWNDLVETASCRNPFVTWEWMYTWWEVFGKEADSLNIIAVYEGESLISIAPFYIQKSFKFFSRLSFIGEGENESDAITTHYPDIIVSKKHQDVAVSSIVRLLTNSLESAYLFDYARFDLVKPDAVIHHVTNGLSKFLKTKNDFTGNQFNLTLPNDDEEYIASLSKSARKQFRLKGNRLNKAGEVVIESETDLFKGLETLEKLHRSRWEDTVSTNIFDSADFKRFHSKLAERMAGQGIIDIRTMKLDGKAIVSSYNFNYNNSCYSYLSGFNSEDDNRLSPMFTFDLMEMKRLIREDYESFDLLISESDVNYKKRFGSKVIPCERVLWIGNSSTSLAFNVYFSLKTRLIKLYKKVYIPK